MTQFVHNARCEIAFTAAMLVLMTVVSFVYGLHIVLPQPAGVEFVGIHYLVPLIVLLILGIVMGANTSAVRKKTLLIQLCCYILVLWVHFNIKMWVPYINPTIYDGFFWSIDQSMRPVVEICFSLRRWIANWIPYGLNLYMFGFITLFYVSFFYHALRTPGVFQQMFLAVLILQGLGALAYLAFPAVGPFLFEQGVSPIARQSQSYMLDVRIHAVQEGPDWLAAHQSTLLAGLGAMPSLHAGSSFLFLWYAARHAHILLPAYMLMFCFILVTAVASRWHYLIDLPFGIALAMASIYVASLVYGSSEPVREDAAGSVSVGVGVLQPLCAGHSASPVPVACGRKKSAVVDSWRGFRHTVTNARRIVSGAFPF